LSLIEPSFAAQLATHNLLDRWHEANGEFDQTVIRAGEIDDPLAFEPPRLVDWDWENRAYLDGEFAD